MTPQTGRTGETARAVENSHESLVTAEVLAEYLGVSRDYVYRNADELGARRLGSGPKARMRFSIADTDSRLTSCPSGRESDAPQSGMVGPRVRRRRSTSTGSRVELLPIRGEARECL